MKYNIFLFCKIEGDIYGLYDLYYVNRSELLMLPMLGFSLKNKSSVVFSTRTDAFTECCYDVFLLKKKTFTKYIIAAEKKANQSAFILVWGIYKKQTDKEKFVMTLDHKVSICLVRTAEPCGSLFSVSFSEFNYLGNSVQENFD